MNAQPAVQSRSTNGYGRRKVDRDVGSRMENKTHIGKTGSGNLSNTGVFSGSKQGAAGGPSRDRLIYVTTCLIGQSVEVYVKNGSIISGTFHTANVEKDFGIILKMARIIKDGSVRGPKAVPETFKKPQNMIIPARELVQIIAKDIALGGDELINGHAREKPPDLLIDSAIPRSHHVDVERELQRWMPDKDDPGCPELENIFDGTWNRTWDQFETNETLFGVKSTFDEELYTTKLERGPQMRDREREALRIAREIEGEGTNDLHLAEERGFHFHDDLGLDEETRFSAVRRDVDDGRFEEGEDATFDSQNVETFGGPQSLSSPSYSDVGKKKFLEDHEGSSHLTSEEKELHSGSSDQVYQAEPDLNGKRLQNLDEDFRHLTKQQFEDKGSSLCIDRLALKDVEASKTDEVQIACNAKAPSPTAAACSSAQENTTDPSDSSKTSAANEVVNFSQRPGSSVSSGSDRLAAASASGRGISPSSSAGSLSSEKSSLNPHAKEFKLNPNAKSFTPSSSLRPHVPISDGTFYYASNIAAVPHVHGLPMGVGVGPTFGVHQQVVYNPQVAHVPTQQVYIPPNGPLYGQHVINGQPRPGFYVPAYPHEMMHKGRNF